MDLSILVEEAVEGCYIGYRARPQIMGSEIGSLYAPSSQNATLSFGRSAVEMVIDINYRSKVSHIKFKFAHIAHVDIRGGN